LTVVAANGSNPPILYQGSALAMLAQPGCPACHCARDATHACLAWLDVEGRASPAFLSRICASRGLCGRHTWQMFAHSGTTSGLADVYRHVVAAVADEPCAAPAGCAVCLRETTAGDSLLDALLDELVTADRRPYKRHGGLCVLHLRRAAKLSRNRDMRWLIRFLITRLTEPAPELELLSGVHYADTERLVKVSPAMSPGEVRASRTCAVCAVVARAEDDGLADARSAGRATGAIHECLCPRHLRDAVAAHLDLTTSLLAWQADWHCRRLAQALDGQPRRLGISAGWLSPRARRALADPDCPVCRGSRAAAVVQVQRIRVLLQEDRYTGFDGLHLCVRHVAQLHAADPAAGEMASRPLTRDARQLLTELSQAIGAEDPPSLSAACGRTASFLDGSVLIGHPAG